MIPGFLSVLVIDHHQITVSAAVSCPRYGTAISGVNAGAYAARQVDSLMSSTPAGSESGRLMVSALERPCVFTRTDCRRSFLGSYQYDFLDRLSLHGSNQIFFLDFLAVLHRHTSGDF